MTTEKYTAQGLATARVVNQVIDSPSAAYSVLKSTLPLGRPSVEDQDKIKAAFDLDMASSVASTLVKGLDIRLLLSEVMRLSSNAIWAETLNRADPKQILDLEAAMGAPKSDIPGMISFANMPLYGYTPVLALAAVFGRDLYDKGIIRENVRPNGVWGGALKMAAEHFDTPVKTMEELIARMKELFPAEEADQQPFSAFNIIKSTGVFNNQGETVTCLVINGTQYFFEAYGRALREDAEPGDYGYDFKDAILSARFKADRAAEERERAEWEKRRGR